MQTGSPALLSALASGARTESHVTRLAGRDLSSQVSSWNLDRSYATDLPGAMRAFSGGASAQLDVDLIGNGTVSAPALYGPWAPRGTGDIVRPGQSVTHGWGLEGQNLDTFRGTVRSRSAESGGDLVRVSALDGAERLRQPARLPRLATSVQNLNTWFPSQKWFASSTWAVDELLRNAGIHTCPPPRERPLFYASLHGGMAPSVGTMDTMDGILSVFSRGSAPHEICLYAVGLEATANYYPAVATATQSSGGLWLEGWLNSISGTNNKVLRYRLQYDTTGGARFLTFEVNLYTGRLTAGYGTSAFYLDNPMATWDTDAYLTQGMYHFGWYLTFSSGYPIFTPTLSHNGSTLWTGAATPITTGGACPPGELRAIHVTVNNIRAEALQVSQVSSRPTTLADVTQAGRWAKGATVGEPRFPLAMIPEVSGDTWSAINDVAKSVLGTAEFDRNGYFRFEGYNRWASPPTVAAIEVSSAREVASLVVSEEIDACRNDVAVDWQNWSGFDYELSGITDLPSPALSIAPGASIIRTMFVNSDEFDPRAPWAISGDLNGWGNLMVRASNSPTGTLVRGTVESSVTRVGSLVTLTVTNRAASGTVYYFGSNMYTGKPRGNLNLPAVAKTTRNNLSSQQRYGIQSYTHAAGEWVQFENDARALADAILNAGAWPAPVLQNVEVLADPRVELGDVVRVRDTTGASLDTLAWVVGIRLSGSPGGVTMVLTLRGTSTNGTPSDTGLTPDPPVKPGTTA